MSDLLSYEELQIGDRWTSPERVVTQADVAQFADLTGDFDRLHTDERFARDTPFSTPHRARVVGTFVRCRAQQQCSGDGTPLLLSVFETGIFCDRYSSATEYTW